MAGNEAVNQPVIQTGLKHKKTTPGTFLFEIPEERAQTALIRNVYVKKAAFLGRQPAEVEVTVKVTKWA